MPPPLLIRADASPSVGGGHAMRCLALAQEWRSTGRAAGRVFVAGENDLGGRYAEEEIELLPIANRAGGPDDALATIALARERGADWVVVDGYDFGDDYLRALREAGLQVLRIDDNGFAVNGLADVVLNQNISAREDMYPSTGSGTSLLLGPRFALLRREFTPWRGWRREITPVACKILVTLGFGPHAETLKVVRALRRLERANLDVVVVGAVPDGTVADEFSSASGRIRFLSHVANMPRWIAWADLAVSAGGSTCWELAFLGLPHLVLVLAENQRGIAEGLDARGVAVNLGWGHALSESAVVEAMAPLLADPHRRQAMSEKGQQLVDGLGAARVLDVLEEKTR